MGEELVPVRANGAKLVRESTIMRMLQSFPSGPGAWGWTYPRIAYGIAYAANDDMLFPGMPTGAEVTACMLVADAWHASKLDPHLRRGYRMGLFQIRPPAFPRIEARDLLDPRGAALIAVDLMRQSVACSAARPAEERLAWYRDLGRTNGVPKDAKRVSREAVTESVAIFGTARTLFERFCREDVRLERAREAPENERTTGYRLLGAPPRGS